MTGDQYQKRAMVQAQIMDLFDHLDRELMQLMGGLARGGDLEGAATTAAAATKRTAAFIGGMVEAEACK